MTLIITFVRWFACANAVLALLGATLLYRPLRAAFVDPNLRLGAAALGAVGG